MLIGLTLAGSAVPIADLGAQEYRARTGRKAVTHVSAEGLQSSPVCNRAAVRECQADAQLSVQICAFLPSRERACAGPALTQLEMCWAATGCW